MPLSERVDRGLHLLGALLISLSVLLLLFTAGLVAVSLGDESPTIHCLQDVPAEALSNDYAPAAERATFNLIPPGIRCVYVKPSGEVTAVRVETFGTELPLSSALISSVSGGIILLFVAIQRRKADRS